MKKILLLFVAFISLMPLAIGQTNWAEVLVRDYSNNPLPGVTVFFYGKDYQRMQEGPERAISRTYADGSGWAMVNLPSNYQLWDTLFFGAVDCNGTHIWSAATYDPNDTINVTLALSCAPTACDYVIFDSIMPTTGGFDLYLEAWSLIDSGYAAPVGNPNFAWLLWPDSTWAYGNSVYFPNFDTSKTNWVELKSFTQCGWIADTINIGSGTPPPPPVPDPNIICKAEWIVDTVNSMVFNGNVIIWDNSLATDTIGDSVAITSYLWDFGDGNYSNQQYPTHTYADTGWQYLCLTITAINGTDSCSSTFCDSVGVDGNGNLLYKNGATGGFTLQVIDPSTVSVIETEAMELNLFPNPAKDMITLNWNGQANSVEIYNMSGVKISDYEIRGEHQKQINIEMLPAGVYLINVKGDNSNETIRFIKQ